MSPFWQAKIWGLLHDPALKALHDNSGRGREGAWQSLTCMAGWVSPKSKSFTQCSYSTQWLKHIGLCDLISSASDRAAIGRLPGNTAIDYNSDGLQIRHLLSGKPQTLKLGKWHDYLINLGKSRAHWLTDVENSLIPDSIRTCTDARKVFWWLWRCYPEVLSKALDRDGHIPNEPCLPLLPAETRLPDASLWSHTSMTAALAGSLAGYSEDANAYPKKRARKNKDYYESRPHVATFTFTPVQELIKASRKMRDFWAGSWLLHYLSAKVCWGIAWKYGPDTFLYPCLYQQPLIDLWLLQAYPDFNEWIQQPSNSQLLTAGFPNVVVMILPDNGASQTTGKIKNPVESAMQQAEQTLREEWIALGNQVLKDLQNGGKPWMPNLNHHTWDDWLKAQWQIYWTALPIGGVNTTLHHSPRKEQYKKWQEDQNKAARPKDDLLVKSESEFLKAIYESALKEDWGDRHSTATKYKSRQPNLNVGSWWGSIFDQTRFSLNAIKNARTWEIPTAFGPRSTVSGIGPVVHSGDDWITEGETAKLWENQAGLFDGIEQLNAVEVVKRGFYQILTDVLFPKPSANREQALSPQQRIRLDLFYPDLSSGVAGWLRTMETEGKQKTIDEYHNICARLQHHFPWANNAAQQSWGIPWIANNHDNWLNPRLLNAGWLIEDFCPQPSYQGQLLTKKDKQEKITDESKRLRDFIGQHFSAGNNPTDWYVLAAGDGDGMSSWLKGEPLKPYSQYLPDALQPKIERLSKELRPPLQDFIKEKKRMGPSTHSALSRALLDFSNQLVPYLTEQRYAGRLIYGGGDDVLAYTNLWEWDNWLWDIRQCFKGVNDPKNEFISEGDYWRWNGEQLPDNLSERPLFTMGHKATISFGIVLAHHSVPMAIALENLWEAEKEAKKHKSPDSKQKDAVQVRILYGNGNILQATSKFDVFHQWQKLAAIDLDSAIFEQAATIWSQHPAPMYEAIEPWTNAFCSRREALKGDEVMQKKFQELLTQFLQGLWLTNEAGTECNRQINNWLKIAAFLIRNRDIKLGGECQ
ncbi:type III-B CRISPR-associated protein Cas10/Cmr2 [Microcoleus sp. B6-A1]|uniref:type III-B CRISPR-associated protein Cas10/Cmr2 n=1 Tax=Microcoleus sp. B6-A1 TaxID=2818684 RepID=UPI002FD49B8A